MMTPNQAGATGASISAGADRNALIDEVIDSMGWGLDAQGHEVVAQSVVLPLEKNHHVAPALGRRRKEGRISRW